MPEVTPASPPPPPAASTEDPPVSPPPPPPASPPVGDPPKFDPASLSDEHRQIFEAKKWGSVEDVLDSYTNLEKRVGANTVVAPTRGETAKFFGENKDALGVPEAVEGYDYQRPELPEGMQWDEGAEKAAREFALERNLPPDLFREMMDFEVQSRINMHKGFAEAAEADEAKTQAELDKAWGADKDRNIEIAKAVPQALGLDEDALAAINARIESPVMLKLFHQIGEMMGEDQLKGAMEGGGGFAPSAAAAQAEIDSLKMNKDFMEVYNNRNAQGHKEAVDKMTALYKRATGE